MINILVIPCGSEVGLEINESLRLHPDINIIGSSSKNDIGMIKFENYIDTIQNCEDDNFGSSLQEAIKKYNIHLIFCTHDTVQDAIAKIEVPDSCKVVNGNTRTSSICRDKLKTYQLFKDEFFCTPFFDNPKQIVKYPIMAKLTKGQGGVGNQILNNFDEARIYKEKNENVVFQDLLDGIEITVDCYTDRNKKLIYAGPRARRRYSTGIALSSYLIQADDEINNIARTINNKIEFSGPWFFQLKKLGSDWKLLEVACRLAGSSIIQRLSGVNLSLLAIYDYKEIPISIKIFNPNLQIERHLSTKIKLPKFNNAYIDFDDTLINNDFKAIPESMEFIYRCIVKNIPITLITRHESDIYRTLEKAKINRNIFNIIIQLKNKEKKSDYIKDVNSIFVDNSFHERQEVHSKTKVLCFSPSELKCLEI